MRQIRLLDAMEIYEDDCRMRAEMAEEEAREAELQRISADSKISRIKFMQNVENASVWNNYWNNPMRITAEATHKMMEGVQQDVKCTVYVPMSSEEQWMYEDFLEDEEKRKQADSDRREFIKRRSRKLRRTLGLRSKQRRARNAANAMDNIYKRDEQDMHYRKKVFGETVAHTKGLGFKTERMYEIAQKRNWI